MLNENGIKYEFAKRTTVKREDKLYIIRVVEHTFFFLPSFLSYLFFFFVKRSMKSAVKNYSRVTKTSPLHHSDIFSSWRILILLAMATSLMIVGGLVLGFHVNKFTITVTRYHAASVRAPSPRRFYHRFPVFEFSRNFSRYH